MGCWGITAFESDAGLDAVEFIRRNLPEDGKLELGKIIEALWQDEWNAPSDVNNAESHTSPMALAEILVKFLDRDISGLDYDEEWAAKDKKFSTITSFAASKESVRWLRDYVSDTLQQVKKNAELRAKYGEEWGGWFKEKDWIGWQEHMTTLASRLDTLLVSSENHIELIPPQGQENGPSMGHGKNDTPNEHVDGPILGM
jgi:hypothetical protein